ncbi:DUF2637 domain-containing protein [Frankia inefficax]|uniref:DUF2637 domain-containing protein n=1 Tax=Pseudofrankia inefficax (strain DSM 45817 / CECT 9037 / DDB 130130 / EuI1c) TaxID=298654 RepID=E3IUT3_PSEI1|nr:Protein of unknown function DUF2637 [Pseudofrankia inefficax]
MACPRDEVVAPAVGRRRGSRWGSGELWIRLATVAAVVIVAIIAGIVSYRHMAGVAREHGEDHTTAAIVPISVDGLIVAASLTLLADSRAGRRRSPLPYALLTLASAASIAANVMHAQPDLAARVIAAWPSAALIGSYELLMSQIRKGRPRPEIAGSPRSPGPDDTRYPAPARVQLTGPTRARHSRNTGTHGSDGQNDLPGRWEARPTAAAEATGDPTVPGQPRSTSASPASKSAHWRPECETPWPDDESGWGEAPEPIPRAVLARVLRTSRRGSKRAQLAAVLLRDIAQDDPRTDYALARDLAPTLNLHTGTARRYLAEWRRQVTTQPTAA